MNWIGITSIVLASLYVAGLVCVWVVWIMDFQRELPGGWIIPAWPYYAFCEIRDGVRKYHGNRCANCGRACTAKAKFCRRCGKAVA